MRRKRGLWDEAKARCPVDQIDRALKQGRTGLRSCCSQRKDYFPAPDYSYEYPRHKRSKAFFYSAVHLSPVVIYVLDIKPRPEEIKNKSPAFSSFCPGRKRSCNLPNSETILPMLIFLIRCRKLVLSEF